MVEENRLTVSASVIIPTHDRAKILSRTLEGISAQSFGEPWEVVVVANACNDGTVNVANRFIADLPLRIVEEATRGVAAARNAGARVARGSILIFLDDDILVEPDFVRRHVELQREFPGCWINGVTVNVGEESETHFGRFRRNLDWSRRYDGEPFPIASFSGQSLSVQKQDFSRLGGFDQRFRRAALEDFDLALRVTQSGGTILLAPSLVSVHNDWAGSTITDFAARQRAYARCEYEMYKKWGNIYSRQDMIRNNWPADIKRDGLALYLRKRVKQLVGFAPVATIVLRICKVAEALRLPDAILHRFYRLLLAAAIYRGFGEGLVEGRT